MFSTTSKHARSSSEPVKPKHRRPSLALSVDPKSTRSASIDMRTTNDVAILTCVELSKSIMKKPEVNTGSLFSTIAASRNDVNRSDAVITIAAAILKTIGSDKSSEIMLNKSRTVMEFYKSMRLDDDTMRTSFVIMLFAIAPEFVKMIESAVKTSIERVQAVTDAPYASTRLLIATSELAKSSQISPTEFTNMMKDVSHLNAAIDNSAMSSPNSIMQTPTDMVRAEDSVSQIGVKHITKSDSPLTAMGLMRYVKGHPGATGDDFYNRFPDARRPINIKRNSGNNGIGYKPSESAIMEDVSESNFTAVMNDLLPSRKPNKRYALTPDDRVMFNNFDFAESVTLADKGVKEIDIPASFATRDMMNDVVTRQDIADEMRFKTNSSYGLSPPNTGITSDDSQLLDLL